MSNKPKFLKSKKNKGQNKTTITSTENPNIYFFNPAHVGKSHYEYCKRVAETLKNKIRDKTFVAYSKELNDMDTLIGVITECLNALMYWNDWELEIFTDWYILAEDLGNWTHVLPKKVRDEYMKIIVNHPYNLGYRFAPPVVRNISGLSANDISRLIS